MTIPKICPRCHSARVHESAISMRDNKTKLCPSCYAREALEKYLDTQYKGQPYWLTEGAANSNGIYSLKSGWLKQPEKDAIPDNVELEPELSEWLNRATNCNTIEDIDSFIDDVYKLRQGSLLTEGEYGKGNLIFKELRNKNILQDLRDKKTELENEEMSLTENIELTEEQKVAQRMKERRQRCVEYYHHLMETISPYAASYNRNKPIIDKDILAKTTAKYGYGSEDIAKFVKGE